MVGIGIDCQFSEYAAFRMVVIRFLSVTKVFVWMVPRPSGWPFFGLSLLLSQLSSPNSNISMPSCRTLRSWFSQHSARAGYVLNWNTRIRWHFTGKIQKEVNMEPCTFAIGDHFPSGHAWMRPPPGLHVENCSASSQYRVARLSVRRAGEQLIHGPHMASPLVSHWPIAGPLPDQCVCMILRHPLAPHLCYRHRDLQPTPALLRTPSRVISRRI